MVKCNLQLLLIDDFRRAQYENNIYSLIDFCQFFVFDQLINISNLFCGNFLELIRKGYSICVFGFRLFFLCFLRYLTWRRVFSPEKFLRSLFRNIKRPCSLRAMIANMWDDIHALKGEKNRNFKIDDYRNIEKMPKECKLGTFIKSKLFHRDKNGSTAVPIL